MPLLFSYGTLQRDDVQRSTFGRLLRGQADALAGFERSLVWIEDAQGGSTYPNVTFTGESDRRVSGMVYEITEAELAAADAYERDAGYERQLVTLASGRRAWVYRQAAGPPVHVRPPRHSRQGEDLEQRS
jgi:gamma-glutamylcyclotransferase (GGCT)/AIG2-like uncharacterized protein YtfP